MRDRPQRREAHLRPPEPPQPRAPSALPRPCRAELALQQALAARRLAHEERKDEVRGEAEDRAVEERARAEARRFGVKRGVRGWQWRGALVEVANEGGGIEEDGEPAEPGASGPVGALAVCK